MTSSDRKPLWQWRVLRRLSKTALAEAAGVTRNTIADIERGKHFPPRSATMRAIADALGVSVYAVDWEAGARERDAKTLAPVA